MWRVVGTEPLSLCHDYCNLFYLGLFGCGLVEVLYAAMTLMAALFLSHSPSMFKIFVFVFVI